MGNLLAEIAAGKKLKKTVPNQRPKEDESSAAEKKSGGGGGGLNMADILSIQKKMTSNRDLAALDEKLRSRPERSELENRGLFNAPQLKKTEHVEKKQAEPTSHEVNFSASLRKTEHVEKKPVSTSHEVNFSASLRKTEVAEKKPASTSHEVNFAAGLRKTGK